MRIYFMIVLLLCSYLSVSQNCNYTLSGTVLDLHDGTPLVGAVLIVKETNQSVQTNLDGQYTIVNLCDATYSIQISHEACLTKGVTVKITENTNKNFRLEHHLEELNQVMIDGKLNNNNTKTLVENTITAEELEKYSSASLGDALKTLSGVSSLNTGNTVVKPLVNGLHSSRVVIINSGVRMEDQEWGAEHAPNIDINSIGNLKLIKGAGALQYSGDAVGGVIIAEPAKVPVKDSLYGKTLLNAGSNGRGGTLTSLLTKSYKSGWYGTAQGTFKYFGDFEAPDYVLSNTGIREKNASLLFGLNRFDYGIEGYYSIFKTNIGILRASHLGGAGDQVRAINSDVPLVIRDFTYDLEAPQQDVTHHLARVNAFKKFNNLGKLSIQYDYQKNNRLEFDIRVGDDKDKPSLDLELDTHTLQLNLDTRLSDHIDFKTGLMTRYQNNFADPSTGVRRLIPDYERYDIGAYAIADYQVNDQLLIEAGARFDYTFIDALKFYQISFWESRGYDQLFSDIVIETPDTNSDLFNQLLANPELNFYNESATLGATYSWGDDNQLFFNYSLASRAPNPSELFSEGLHHSASRIEIGDLRFDSETGHKFSVALEKSNETYSFSINPYLNTINNFILLEPVDIRNTLRGDFQVWEYRQTNATLLGIDVDASYKFATNFQFDHQFSLVKGYDRSRNDEPLINMPPVNTRNSITYRNTELNNLNISLESQYTFKQNEYPDNNFLAFIPETQTEVLVDVSSTPDAYHLMNFNSSIDFVLNNKSTLTMGLGITNLFNTSYRDYLNRLRFYADNLGRNVLLNIKINY